MVQDGWLFRFMLRSVKIVKIQQNVKQFRWLLKVIATFRRILKQLICDEIDQLFWYNFLKEFVDELKM